MTRGRYLIDTHVFLWAAGVSSRLTNTVAAVLADRDNEIFVSAAAVWEIAVKFALKRLSLPTSPDVFVPMRLRAMGCAELPIDHRHALAVGHLARHHNDPFDRLMIAQAQLEGLTFVTADRNNLKYPCRLLNAS